MEIGKNIRTIRKARSIKQVQLAQMTGISQEAIACYESGIRTPGLENIEKLAKALAVSYDELLGTATPSPMPEMAVRGNTRTAKMIEIFESLKPSQQRDIIKQTSALVGVVNG